MALVKCPECKKEVSHRAKSCPSCGHPLEQVVTTETPARKGKGFKLVWLGAILVGIMVAFSTPIAQGGILAGFLIAGGLIGLLAGTSVFIYLVAIYWGVVLGFIIFLAP